MRQLTTLLSLCFSTFFVFSLNAQIGCPGCVVNLPADLPADTLLLQDLPDGQKGVAYNQDISFRMPKTTTPVNAIDSITPPGLPISQIEILSIEGVPPGLFWQPNQTIFQTANQTDGCVKFCGTPTQSDSFVMTVKIKATVFFITQEATFPLRIYIAPEVSITEGFTMTDFTGCGSTTVTFTNNVPSGGNPGFSYQWDFGDGTTFEGENPPPHSYDEPGVYPVSYYAKIDTSPFVLASVKVLSVGCSDAFNNPDLYFLVFNPSGEKIFDSSPHVNNTPLPYTWPVNLILDTTLTYTIAVWDEDSGLKGTDDPCGEVTFTVNNSGDTLTSGPLGLILTILHDVKEVFSTDTVYVYAQPAPPSILAPNGLSECVGANTLLLLSSSGVGNQWWLDELPIPNETSFLHNPKQTGHYQVSVTTPDGCSAFSDSVLVEIYPLPDSPLYINVNNSLRLVDTSALPAQYALQWYNGNDPIPGETGFRYCATQSGNYGLLVTDLATGCMSFYSSTVMYDPSFDCTVSAGEVAALVLGILPNPAAEQVQVRWGKPLSNGGSLRLWDAAGRLVKTMPLADGANAHSFDCGDVNVGYYTVEIVTEGFRGIGKLAVMR
ncbi:MAG: PKD domain-containing protein [Saprospiraceae bacterium]|nr:PKD domain-containing protein [Saprospiraceae bacterium]